MCQHITTTYRCRLCTTRFFTDTISCSAEWYKRIGRHQCDNTDWTMVEDPSEKLCPSCSERYGDMPIVLESDPLSPVLETSSLFGPFSEFNANTAPYVDARLEDWCERHPEREGAIVQTHIAGAGELMDAMSGLCIDVEGGTGSSSGAEPSGSALPAEPEGSTPLLFADVLTQSPEMIDIDEYGFEKQKVVGAKDWTLKAKWVLDEEDWTLDEKNRTLVGKEWNLDGKKQGLTEVIVTYCGWLTSMAVSVEP